MSENLPVPTKPAFAPVHYDAAIEHVILWVRSGGHYQGSQLLTDNLPTPADRQALGVRARALVSALKMSNVGEKAQSIGSMLACWRDTLWGGADDPNARRKVIGKFVQEVDGIPTWAVQRACDTIRMGNAPSKIGDADLGISMAFPPSTVSVRKLAESYTNPFRKELTDIGDVLRAKKIEHAVPEAERESVKAGLTSLARDMRSRLEPDANDPAVIRESLINRVGQAAFDAIPDAPKTSRFWQGIRDVKVGKANEDLGADDCR